jgi:ribosomal-protein-alanine N-acetyltransferase
VIRAGNAQDLAAISAIQDACPEAAHWPPSDYLNYDLHVAVCDGRVAGFLAVRAAAGEAEILNLAVAPTFRRRGLARALLGGFLQAFPGPVFLEVRESNTAARRTYQALGFTEVNIRGSYYASPPEAAIVMKFHSC